MNGRSLAVVGGGITGLATALFAARRGARVTVFDAAETAGGLSVAADYGGFTWDRFYHVIAPGDRALLTLLDELGLGGSVRWAPTRQAVWLRDAVRPLRGVLDLARLPGLRLIDVWRLGRLVLRARSGRPMGDLDAVAAGDWVRAHCGERVWQVLWRHLLRSKLGDAAPTVSARFLHATLARLGAARKATGGGERFGYVRGGYRQVLDALLQALAALGVTVRTGARVQQVRADGAGVQVALAGGVQAFDRAIATLPNPALGDVLVDLPPATAAALRATTYLGVVCTVAVGEAPLGGHYITNLCDDRLALTGIIETTAVVDAAAETAGRTLVYLPRYAPAGSPLFAAADDELAARALDDLARVYPHTRQGWLRHRAVHRARWIQPVPQTGAAPVRPPRIAVPGRVACVNNAQLPSCVLNNDDCVALARAAVTALADADFR